MVSVQIPRRFTRHSWGGTETVVFESCKAMQQLGQRPSVFTSSAFDQVGEEHMDGLPIHRFSYFYPYLGLKPEQKITLDQSGGNLFSWSLAKALYQKPSLDLIHLHTSKRLGGIGRSIARLRKLPYVVSLHGGMFCRPHSEQKTVGTTTQGAFEYGKALGWAVGSRRVLQDASAILCLSQQEREAIRARFPSKRVEILPNGVDLERFQKGNGQRFRFRHQIPMQAKVLGVIGRIAPQKNQLLAIQSLPRLQDPKAHLLLVGPVTDRAYCYRVRQSIQELGLEKRVTLIEGLSGQDLVDSYHACQLVVVPSVHEPFGIAVLEAWASRKPVLASAVGGLQDLLSDGRCGQLFDSDDPLLVAKLVSDFFRNPRLCWEKGESGHIRVAQRFTWDAHVKHLTQLYREVRDEYRSGQ